ncbi:MAG: hypothetical protein ACUVQ0_00710 [Thermoproteota archaeon]
MRWKDLECFAILEADLRDSRAGLVFSSMRPDEHIRVKGLRVSSSLRDGKIVFKAACRRGLLSLAHTLCEYLYYLRMIVEAASILEEATCPEGEAHNYPRGS